VRNGDCDGAREQTRRAPARSPRRVDRTGRRVRATPLPSSSSSGSSKASSSSSATASDLAATGPTSGWLHCNSTAAMQRRRSRPPSARSPARCSTRSGARLSCARAETAPPAASSGNWPPRGNRTRRRRAPPARATSRTLRRPHWSDESANSAGSCNSRELPMPTSGELPLLRCCDRREHGCSNSSPAAMTCCGS
jgi:hypothetical protein